MIKVWRINAQTKEESQNALRIILQRAVGHPFSIGTRLRGKPFLVDFPRLSFNLSHTKGKALVAFGIDVEVGVDIERLRPMRDLDAIAERYLPPGDAEALADTAEPDRQREFFRRWTRAEAIWKAAGLGLYSAGAVPEGEWHVYDVDAGDGYAAAVAASRADIPIDVCDFGFDIRDME